MFKQIGIFGIFVLLSALAAVGLPGSSAASEFTDTLSKEYFGLARVQYYYSHDHFAVKARAADQGKNVLPDDPSKQKKLSDKDRADLVTAHGQLMAALNGGFRTQNPKQAARAQTMFDCWLWAVIERDKKCIGKCRDGFRMAMQAWSPPQVAQPPIPKPEPVAKPAPKPAPPRSFIVFFDWDRSSIRADAQEVLDAAAAYAKERGFSRVSLTGHADRSGKASYNLGLSKRRADGVKAALVNRGLQGANISVEARGESAPLVSTTDGVREPRNRRVEIGF